MWVSYKIRRLLKARDERIANLEAGRAVCFSCGYVIPDIPGEEHDLYEGYGCPECKSPFVVVKATGKEIDHLGGD